MRCFSQWDRTCPSLIGGKPRSTVLDAALIRFGDVSVCCAIRDLSEGGAALDIGKQTGIPDQFTLIVPRGKIYPCTVIWRKPGRIGVSFI